MFFGWEGDRKPGGKYCNGSLPTGDVFKSLIDLQLSLREDMNTHLSVISIVT